MLLLALIAAHERAWNANWSATSLSYEDTRAAFRELIQAEETWMRCARTSTPPLDFGCVCGNCGARYAAAVDHVEDAKDTHEASCARFKAGVTFDQHAAQMGF